MRLFSKVCFFAVMVAAFGCGGSGDDVSMVTGESQVVGELTARTSARIVNGMVTEVVATVPRGMLVNPPEEMGDGPAGSFLSMDYPAAVQSTTFLNHFELHFNPGGHPPQVFLVPHFDLHAYSIPEAQVRAIPVPDTMAPAANRVPAGYMYAGVNDAIPEMGVHAMREQDMEPPFTQVMVHGFSQGNMIFVEPMVHQDQFKNKAEFTLPITAPEVLGRATRYPTRFTADYDENTDTYRFVFDQFVGMN
jgi:hypothetical protein